MKTVHNGNDTLQQVEVISQSQGSLYNPIRLKVIVALNNNAYSVTTT